MEGPIMRVDTRDKTVDLQVTTAFHTFYFGHSELPKELDLFNSEKHYLTDINGYKVHKGFYRAMLSFIEQYKRVWIELTDKELDFLENVEPKHYEMYIAKHKKVPIKQDVVVEKPKKSKK